MLMQSQTPFSYCKQ